MLKSGVTSSDYLQKTDSIEMIETTTEKQKKKKKIKNIIQKDMIIFKHFLNSFKFSLRNVKRKCKPAHEYQRICARVHLELFPGNKTPQIYLSQHYGVTIFQLLPTASTAFVRLLQLCGLHCSCCRMAVLLEFVVLQYW